MANMRLFFCNRQLECLLNISLDLLPDFFGIGLRANDAETKIICVSTVIESFVFTIEWISTRICSAELLEVFDRSLDVLKFFFCSLLSLQGIPFLSEFRDLVGIAAIGRIILAFLPLPELLFHGLHETV